MNVGNSHVFAFDHAHTIDPLLAQVIEQQESYFRKILTLDCSTSFQIKPSKELAQKSNGQWKDTNIQIHLILDGPLYWSEVKSSDANNILSNVICAYDGKHRQRMDFGSKVVLDLSKTNRTPAPYGSMDVLLLAYGWAFTKNDVVSLAPLKSSETWSKLATKTIEIREDTMNGQKGVVWVLKGRERPGTGFDIKTIFFSDDAGGFPISFTLHDSKKRLRSKCNVTKFKLFSNDGEEILFPTIMDVKTYYGPDLTCPVTTMCKVDEATLQINKAIADKTIFTLPVSQSDICTDLDTGIVLKMSHEEESMIATITNNKKQPTVKTTRKIGLPATHLPDNDRLVTHKKKWGTLLLGIFLVLATIITLRWIVINKKQKC